MRAQTERANDDRASEPAPMSLPAIPSQTRSSRRANACANVSRAWRQRETSQRSGWNRETLTETAAIGRVNSSRIHWIRDDADRGCGDSSRAAALGVRDRQHARRAAQGSSARHDIRRVLGQPASFVRGANPIRCLNTGAPSPSEMVRHRGRFRHACRWATSKVPAWRRRYFSRPTGRKSCKW